MRRQGISQQTHQPAAQDEVTVDILRLLLSILLPPLGVFLQVGLTLHFWINVLLTILGYVPGIIHAVYIIMTRSRPQMA